MYLKAFAAVVVLLAILISMNVHTAFLGFLKDRDKAKLIVYLGTLVLLVSLIVNVAYRVIDKSVDASTTDLSRLDQD